jgi:hypothetical protein
MDLKKYNTDFSGSEYGPLVDCHETGNFLSTLGLSASKQGHRCACAWLIISEPQE